MRRIFALTLIIAGLLDARALFAAESMAELRAKAEVLFASENLAELRAKAENGDAKAQADLGLRYFMDEGLAKHRTEAIGWFRKAADQGDASAQTVVGGMYATGEIVAKNPAEAAKWYRKAADQGYNVAQYFLGKMYYEGEGVVKDATEAVRWYRKSAEQGNAGAQFLLALMLFQGDGVTKNLTEAAKWSRQAADQGDAGAQCLLGSMYASGQGVTKDPKEAAIWFRRAAEQGNAMAQTSLGWSYANGKGATKDLKEAAKWFRRAADQGIAEAQVRLGGMYASGHGVRKDPMEAVKCYRKAVEQGNADAQLFLGLSYETGKGVLKDEIEALAWYNINAVSGDERAVTIRDALERRLGQQSALVAQKRSKEILKQIEANQARTGRSVTTAYPLQPYSNERPKSSGSGAIVSSSGHILTAAHVVAEATSVTVITTQGTRAATVVRVDESNDLAVLKISDGTYPPLPVASSRLIRLGQAVATIGFPNIGIQGSGPKLTRGEISSLNGAGDDPRSWQISVPVQPGNSGGPLLDENGNLIGVVLAKLGLKAARATGDLPQNVGYAVKSAYALPLLEPYLAGRAGEANQASGKLSFEDMVAKAQQSAVLILIY